MMDQMLGMENILYCTGTYLSKTNESKGEL